MLFNSYIFIFIFLPITLAGWYALNRIKAYESAKFFLAGMSLWFYGYFNIYYLAVIIVSILSNYLVSYLIGLTRKTFTRRTIHLLSFCGGRRCQGHFQNN